MEVSEVLHTQTHVLGRMGMAETCQKSLLSGVGRSLGAKISGGRGRQWGIFFGFYKTRHILLSNSANCTVLRAVVLTQYRRDGRTDGIVACCNKLGLTTLYDRRLRGDLIEPYKIITDKENVKKEVFFEFSDTGYNFRGHCYKLATKRSHLEVRRNYFSQRVVRAWNLLPAHIVEAPSVNAFKNRYDLWKSGAP